MLFLVGGIGLALNTETFLVPHLLKDQPPPPRGGADSILPEELRQEYVGRSDDSRSQGCAEK